MQIVGFLTTRLISVLPLERSLNLILQQIFLMSEIFGLLLIFNGVLGFTNCSILIVVYIFFL